MFYLSTYISQVTLSRGELYGLTSQMRRSSASIGANIAEGCCRKGDSELARFLQIAMGSASELEYHLLLAHDLHLLNGTEYGPLEQDVTEVKRMLAAFIQQLHGKRPNTDGSELRADG